jgi:hypothetical protein
LRAVGFTRVLVGVGVTVTVGVAVTVLVVVTVGAGGSTAAAVLAGDGAVDEQPAVSATARTAMVRRERIFGPFKLGS